MLTTTLNTIRSHGPCESGWRKLLAHLGKTKPDDEPLSLCTILESNGTRDALWCLRCWPKHSPWWRLLAGMNARTVQHLMQDPRSLQALAVAERHAYGDATDAELFAARAAAEAAEAEAEVARAAAELEEGRER